MNRLMSMTFVCLISIFLSAASAFTLKVEVEPSHAAQASMASAEYDEGATIDLWVSGNANYVFKGWYVGDERVSESEYFTFTMPGRDTTLRAAYEYDPETPGDPEAIGPLHTLILEAVPQDAGFFNESEIKAPEGADVDLWAYFNNGYRFLRWESEDRTLLSTENGLRLTMPGHDSKVFGIFEFNPDTPGNPNGNFWDPETGLAIIDDFREDHLYEALANTVGYDDLLKVRELIVQGHLGLSDLDMLPDLDIEEIDLSRTGGFTALSPRQFSGLKASVLILPYTIESVGDYAFYGCENLVSLTVYALAPPKCDPEAFEEFTNKDNCTVFVPASAVGLYEEAEGWKDFIILPILSGTHMLQVNLPDDANDGRYRNYSLELVNVNTGVRQKYVVSDRIAYTFSGLQKGETFDVTLLSPTGVEIGRIENVVILDEDSEAEFEWLRTLCPVSAVVMAGEKDVTSAASIEWLCPREESDAMYLKKGADLGMAPEGQELICRVTLDVDLGGAYRNPDAVRFTVDEDNVSCVVDLVPFRSIAVSGKVTDADGAAMAGAAVTAVQTLNGRYSKTAVAKSDAEGVWSLTVADAPETFLTFSAPECVNVNDTIPALADDVNAFDHGVTILRSIVGARINYGFTYRDAGEEEAADGYDDWHNVVVDVYNVTQGRPHSDISMQYPVLAVLDEGIKAGDVLRLTARSKTNGFVPVSKDVTVGENQRADVVFDLVGKGGIAASFETTENPAVNAMLYDANGELVKKTAYAEAKARFTSLEEGDYTLVSMGRSGVMNSILRLSAFGDAGLKEGRDYVRNDVKVSNGIITEIRISEVPAFDESLFYYTGNSTSFTANKTSIPNGSYLTLRANIDFKEVYRDEIGNVALVVDLPDACEFVEQSVIQGPNLLPYTYDNHRLTIQLGENYLGQVRFCVIPTKGGMFKSSASVTFGLGEKEISQPIGTATSEVKDLEFSIPNTVAKPTFHALGVAPAGSEVRILDDGVLIGAGKANAKGDWDIECTLIEPEDMSRHNVCAEIAPESGTVLTSESRILVYDPNSIQVIKVTMVNTAHTSWSLDLCDYVTVFDFQNPRKPETYWYWPEYPKFTFMIDISCRSPRLVPIVWLHVYTSDGEVRSMIADYDEEKDCWMVVDDFLSEALPTRVSVTLEDMRYDCGDEADYEMLIDEFIGDIQIKDSKVDEDGHVTVDYTDENGNDLMQFEAYDSGLSEEELIEKLKEEGFEEEEVVNDDSGYEPKDDEEEYDKNTKVLVKDDGSMAVVDGPLVAIIWHSHNEKEQSAPELISDTISREWNGHYFTKFISSNCGWEIVTTWRHYQEHFQKYVRVITITKIAERVFVDYRLLPPGTVVPKKKILGVTRRLKYSSKTYTTYTEESSVISSKTKCPEPEPPTPPTPPTPPAENVMDPSGFVYEAVPANRVEGVQASIYYKETKEDMYGDPYEEVVLWNAEEYAQQNPLFTDENGMYQWDVPQGLWQVKFEKDGYATAYSEWLPVPPPQLEVNIGIVQLKQPEVAEARAYEDGVEVRFDKYMDISTLTADNIFVTADGKKLAGEVVLLDASEADPYADKNDPTALRHASRVRFVPEQRLSVTTGEVRLTVSRDVLSYAGVPMTDTYSQTLDVEKEVQAIYADDVKVLYGDEKEITVFALPAEAAAERTLRIASSSALTTSVSATEVTLDKEGKATFTVKGSLPGRAQLTFTIDGVTAKGDCMIDVVTEMITAEAPTASRASGSAVYRGSKVALSTESKNGTIWFTTDGSCPCDENGTRRKYTVPIVIDEDTHILAMTAVGDSDDDISEVVEFNYTLKRADMDLTMEEGWTWISHCFDYPVDVTVLSECPDVYHIQGIDKSCELEAGTDHKMGGDLMQLNAYECYKVGASARVALPRLSDVAWNPANSIEVKAGWNWIGYPVDHALSVSDALSPTAADALDVIVGQKGFAQYDGQGWIGTLDQLTPGEGYLYLSQAPKSVRYDSTVKSVQSKGKRNASSPLPYAVDIHGHKDVMPVVATIADLNGTPLDCERYQVVAMSGDECRGIGSLVDGRIMMNVYGDGSGTPISFRVFDAEKGSEYSCSASLSFKEDIVGDVFNPWEIQINPISGVSVLRDEDSINCTIEGETLHLRGVDPASVDYVEIFNLDGIKVRRICRPASLDMNVGHLGDGVFFIVVSHDGNRSYMKVITD